jgi:Amt family ammonium transporter
MASEWWRRGTPSVLGLVSGAVAGLVAITPASGFVGITGGLVIGGGAGVACYLGSTVLKGWLGYDDTLDVFGIHAIGGIVGSLLTAVFVDKAIGGVSTTLATQAFGVGVTALYAGGMTALILMVVYALIGLRVDSRTELEGLDTEQHGETVA